MIPLDAVTVSRKDLSALEDLARELCDLMTLLIYHSGSLPTNPPTALFERMMIINGLVAMSERKFKAWLEIVGRIQDSTGSWDTLNSAKGF
jgi:hypothetical protein